jgi:hypothetical protein
MKELGWRIETRTADAQLANTVRRKEGSMRDRGKKSLKQDFDPQSSLPLTAGDKHD